MSNTPTFNSTLYHFDGRVYTTFAALANAYRKAKGYFPVSLDPKDYVLDGNVAHLYYS
jgi:hypothetical protein